MRELQTREDPNGLEGGDAKSALEPLRSSRRRRARRSGATRTSARTACRAALGLRNPRLALGYLELGGKLNGEIGRRGASMPTQPENIVVGHGTEAIAAWRAAAARIIQEEDAQPQ